MSLKAISPPVFVYWWRWSTNSIHRYRHDNLLVSYEVEKSLLMIIVVLGCGFLFLIYEGSWLFFFNIALYCFLFLAPIIQHVFFFICQKQRSSYCVLSFSTKAVCGPESGLLYPLGNVVHSYYRCADRKCSCDLV